MDAVLGVSMTPTSVGLVLVEGADADGATMDRDAFEVHEYDTSQEATAAVLRTEAMAARRGVRLHSIGVTWSADADDQASALLRSLSENGFDNVVPIRMPEATEALARGSAEALGFQTTAVCVIESDTVISLIVHADGAIHTSFNRAIDTEESLISWLSSVFTRADWQPEALVVVGSAGGFDDILPLLEDALSVPVYSPAEAELALARGAALASSSGGEPRSAPAERTGGFAQLPPPAVVGRPGSARGRRWLTARTGATALLTAGAVTFVASASVAVSLALAPERPAPVERAAPVERSVPSAVPPAASTPPAAPAPPPVEAPPLEPPAAPPVEEAVPVFPEEPAPAPEFPEAVEGTVPDPALLPPPPPAVEPPEKKPLRTRIMDRLRGVGDPDPAEFAPPVPPPVPAP